MTRVAIKPEMFSWARERAGFSAEALAHRFPQLEKWESQEGLPTLRQLEQFAKATHAPVGYFFLPAPPVEKVPIPDFRTAGNEYIGRPSPDLLDMIYVCQQRQEWYRDHLRYLGEDKHGLVGSIRLGQDVAAAARKVREWLGFSLEQRREASTWTDALRLFIEHTDSKGILVMCSGVVLNNNRRHLNPEEFRGFAIADDIAPLIFINGADTKAAQMFTLAHEIIHICVGQSALTDSEANQLPDQELERWCNQVAAEFLVPLDELQADFSKRVDLAGEVKRLAARFKVSTLVILRRIYDAGGLTRKQFWEKYHEELDRLRAIPRGTGGNFYLTQAARASKRFSRALVASTLEGQTLYRDAFRMLGFSKHDTFVELGRNLGMAL